MKLSRKQARRLRQGLLAPVLLLAAVAVSGCRTASYYGQAIKGHYQVVARQEKIEKLLADPETPEPLRAKLGLVQELRAFAANDLKLPVNGHYRKYADVHRPFVVWNVEAAPEFSLEAKTWWYPFVGSLEGNVPRVVEIEVVLKFHLGSFKGWGGFPFMQDLFQ